MQYYIQSKFFWLRSLIAYIVVAVLMLSIELIGVTTFLEDAYVKITLPVTQPSTQVAFWLHARMEQLQNMWQAADEVALLQKEKAVLQAEIAQLSVVQKENQALKSILGDDLTVQNASTQQFATVIGYATPTVTSTEELRIGQVVMANNILLGIVAEAFQNQATVRLLSHSATQPLLVRAEGGAEGIISGNNRSVLMTDVPKDKKINSGEQVITMGQEGIPAGLFIGTVAEVVDQPTSPVLTFTIAQPTTFFDTTIVEIR